MIKEKKNKGYPCRDLAERKLFMSVERKSLRLMESIPVDMGFLIQKE